MFPSFDPDELSLVDLSAQVRYARRVRGDACDRFRLWWKLMHQSVFARGSRILSTERNQLWRDWDRAKARRIIPRGRRSTGYPFMKRLLNRQVRQRVRVALRTGEEFDPRQFERRMPWMD